MLRPVVASLTLLTLAAAALAQTPPPVRSFEVATIKPTDPAFGGILVQMPGGALTLRGFTVKDIIGLAYDVDNRQVVGVPKALEAARYDVVAKADVPITPAAIEDVKLMVQTLLAQRFQFAFHRETREVPVYAMRVGRNGHKMRPRKSGDGGAPMGMLFQGANLPGRDVSMAILAGGLQKVVLDRPVLDKTGLEGNFDFDLTWRPDPSQFGGRGGQLPAAADPDRADIFTAIQEQLGLELDAERGPAPVIVVDKVEPPSEN